MEAPAELLAALPVLVTALALLLAWLLVRRGPSAEPAPPAKVPGTPAPPGPCAPEPAAAPEAPGEREGPGEREAAPAEAEEQAAEARQEEEEPEQEQEQEQDGQESPLQAGPEEEDGGDVFSFKYSPGKLRGNQYKTMMTKEELEEEQRA